MPMKRGKKILIIDDDARNIFALTAVLRAKGFASVSSPSAGEGIDRLRSDLEIGIVFMDMMMPDMDGYAAISQIRGDAALASVPVISVTAQAMAGDREKCLSAGANDYLSKPIDQDAMLRLLHSYLG